MRNSEDVAKPTIMRLVESYVGVTAASTQCFYLTCQIIAPENIIAVTSSERALKVMIECCPLSAGEYETQTLGRREICASSFRHWFELLRSPSNVPFDGIKEDREFQSARWFMPAVVYPKSTITGWFSTGLEANSGVSGAIQARFISTTL